ncbi:MAG TPA: hypothetical protein VGB13_10685 [Candidatus Krumholzibacteria bacterium]
MTTDVSQALQSAETEAQKAETDSIAMLAQAEGFTIASNTQYEQSAALLQSIKGKQKDLEGLRKSITRPIDEAKQRVMKLFSPSADRLANAELKLKRAMLAFTQENKRKQEEAQAALRERERKERERLERQAEKAREKGQEEKAAALEQKAEDVPELEVVVPEPEVEGISMRVTWRADVVDLLALVKAVAAGEQALSMIEPNMKQLNGLARAMKEDLAVPGVKAVSEEGIAARA